MVILEDLLGQFESLNVSVDSKVLAKCEELCTTYNIDPEDFIDQWLAYTASNLSGEPPSLDTLAALERNELQKRKRNGAIGTPSTRRVEAEPVVTPVRQNLREQWQEESPTVNRVEIVAQDVPSQNFTNRSGACSVQYQFGECDAHNFTERCSGGSFVITVKNGEIASSKYMYEKFLVKRDALNNISRVVIGDILAHHKLEITREKLKQYSGEMVICGRILSEHPGKLETGSVLLEGLLEIYRGQVIRISVNKLENVSLFSGQSVVIKGDNMQDWFSAKEIITGAPLTPPERPLQLTQTLQIVAAAGPFTLSENLLYEPLEQLLKYVTEFRPNLLILMGPFLQGTHPLVETLCESYDSFFENIVGGIMERLKDIGIRVVLVPSHEDVHNHVVFPSLPYKIRKRYDNLLLAPNPFVLDVDGLKVSGSTADVLFHVSKVECSKNTHQKDSRIGRLVSHIFNQRSFYPLHPPDPDVKVDYQLVEQYAMFDGAPHLMFLPSKFRYFVRVVEDCVVINPERLIKGTGAGTFARVEVRAGRVDQKLCDRVSCQIYSV